MKFIIAKQIRLLEVARIIIRNFVTFFIYEFYTFKFAYNVNIGFFFFAMRGFVLLSWQEFRIIRAEYTDRPVKKKKKNGRPEGP